MSLHTLIPLFTPRLVHSGWASWDDCDWVFPDELRVSSFPDRVPTLCLDSGIVSSFWRCWIKGVCVFRCNLPPAPFGRMTGSFYVLRHTGMKRTPNKSQHTELRAAGEENSPAAPAGIRTRNLSLTSPGVCQQAIPAPLVPHDNWRVPIWSPKFNVKFWCEEENTLKKYR